MTGEKGLLTRNDWYFLLSGDARPAVIGDGPEKESQCRAPQEKPSRGDGEKVEKKNGETEKN